MKETMKTLIEELFAMDTLHQEYLDEDTHYVIDTEKEGNTLTIKVELIENKDKVEFEKWLEGIDDDFFAEILDTIHKEDKLLDLNKMYQSENYKEVINLIKFTAKQIALKKIEKYQNFTEY